MEQCTLDAIGVLIISPTAGGGGLGRLRCNVDSEGGKYTSATPRCTCPPPCQHCAEVALGGKQVHLGYASVYLLSSSCNFSSSTPRPSSSTPRLRLGVLELGLSVLERSQPSTPPPAVVLIPTYPSKVARSRAGCQMKLSHLVRVIADLHPPSLQMVMQQFLVKIADDG